MKPFVTYEKRMFETNYPISYVSRRKRKLLNEPYPSAVIQDLSPFDIVLSGSTQDLLMEAIEVLAKLDGFAKDELVAFPMLLLRTEALSSSQIENYHASNRNVALAQINKKNTKEAKIIQSNLEALIQSVTEQREIDVDFLIAIHRQLMNHLGSMDEPVGIRKVVNWIGTSNQSPHDAEYVPPHPDRLKTYLSQFLTFIHRNDLHPLIIAAFSHAYFELIHPFADGNGRVGRILIQVILNQSRFLEHAYVPFSVGLVKNQRRYIESLNAFKSGDFDPIIRLLLETALNMVPRIYHALEEMVALKKTWQNRITARKDALVWTILDDLLVQPVFDVEYLVTKHSANDQTVRNNIEILLQADIISKLGNAKRDVAYECQGVLALLDDFLI